MEKLYDRADIYDLFDNESRYNVIREHWKTILYGKEICSFLDVSYGTGNLTLPLAELGVELYGSDLSAAMLNRGRVKAEKRGFRSIYVNVISESLRIIFGNILTVLAVQVTRSLMYPTTIYLRCWNR